jgi:cytochrome c553
MTMTRKHVFTFAAATGLILAQGAHANNGPADGKGAYEYYRCGGCHGSDGRGSTADPKAGNIAGMTSHSVIQAVNVLIAKGGHEAHMSSGCGETPTKAQVQAIADFIANLSK